MLNLFRFLGRRAKRRDPRRIFRYYDGRRVRYADPKSIYAKLNNHPIVKFDSEVDAMHVEMGKEPEYTNWVRACREIFEAHDFDPKTGRGLTDAEAIDLPTDFFLYLVSLKKNINPTPISSEPTAPEFSTASTDPEATNDTSDFGSTPNGPNSAAPGVGSTPE